MEYIGEICLFILKYFVYLYDCVSVYVHELTTRRDNAFWKINFFFGLEMTFSLLESQSMTTFSLTKHRHIQLNLIIIRI